jgi:uncharacterized UPF0160 family protein
MKIVTHNDRFHADDVCAMAILRIHFGDAITEVIRTRDEEIIKSADLVFDVGNIYDPARNRFDHHQSEGAGTRENGVPYAAFGLVWKKFGIEICGSQEVADLIDKKIVQMIDASDNGYSLYTYAQEHVHEYVLDTICGAFGATWKEEDNYDEAFFEVVGIFEKILRREIKITQDKFEAFPLVQKTYQESEDKRLLVLDEYYPWHDALKGADELLFVISPSKDKKLWRINAIQEEKFKNKKDLPLMWRGLRDIELEQASGVRGAIFCHRTGFMAAANSKESAIKLAKIALES